MSIWYYENEWWFTWGCWALGAALFSATCQRFCCTSDSNRKCSTTLKTFLGCFVFFLPCLWIPGCFLAYFCIKEKCPLCGEDVKSLSSSHRPGCLQRNKEAFDSLENSSLYSCKGCHETMKADSTPLKLWPPHKLHSARCCKCKHQFINISNIHHCFICDKSLCENHWSPEANSPLVVDFGEMDDIPIKKGLSGDAEDRLQLLSKIETDSAQTNPVPEPLKPGGQYPPLIPQGQTAYSSVEPPGGIYPPQPTGDVYPPQSPSGMYLPQPPANQAGSPSISKPVTPMMIHSPLRPEDSTVSSFKMMPTSEEIQPEPSDTTILPKSLTRSQYKIESERSAGKKPDASSCKPYKPTNIDSKPYISPNTSDASYKAYIPPVNPYIPQGPGASTFNTSTTGENPYNSSIPTDISIEPYATGENPYSSYTPGENPYSSSSPSSTYRPYTSSNIDSMSTTALSLPPYEPYSSETPYSTANRESLQPVVLESTYYNSISEDNLKPVALVLSDEFSPAPPSYDDAINS